jgi:tRNA A37 N6-isopentenylltransferase MiaA
MLDDGWIEEVEGLLEAGTVEGAPGFQSLGYDEVIALVRGRTDYDEVLENVVRKTRRFARRQRVWFRRMDVSLAGNAEELDCETILRGWREHTSKYGKENVQ